MGAEHPHRTYCPKCRCTFATDKCPCGVTAYDHTFALNRLCDCYACGDRTRPLYLADIAAGRIRTTTLPTQKDG